MCDLDYGYMGFTRNIIKIKGKTVQYDDMSLESACENENNVLLLNPFSSNIYTQGDVNVKGTDSWLLVRKIVPVKPNTNYQIKLDIESISKGSNNFSPNVEFYSNTTNGSNFLYRLYSSGSFTLTTRADTTTLVIVCVINNETVSTTECEANFKNIKIQERNDISLPQPLRSLPNGVCDTIVGNKLIQRVGKYTITGTETYDLRFKNDYMFVVQFNDILTEPAFGDYNNSNTKMICDKALCRDCSNTTFVSNSLTIGGRTTSSKGFIVAIPTRLLTEYTVPNAKQYIQSLGGMTVYYELATPIEHTIDINIKKIKKSKCYNKIKPTII